MLRKNVLLFFLILLTGNLLAKDIFTVTKIDAISLTDLYLIAPKWSPDGNYIAASGEKYSSIWLFELETKNWVRLVEENGAGWDFDWSPDSKKIAFRSNRFVSFRKQTTIKYIDIITKKVEKVIDYSRDFSTPKWLTSDILAFIHKKQLKTFSILKTALIKPDSNLQQKNVCIFSNENIYISKFNQPFAFLAPLKGQTFNVTFSPNGQSILFEKAGGKIYTCRENGDEVTLVAEGEMPSWSPDGSYIVYANAKDDGYRFLSSDIYI